MKYRIVSMESFTVIGFQKYFDAETSYTEIPKFWDEIFEKYGRCPSDPCGQAAADNRIGEYGVCIDDAGVGRFRYMIAGRYAGGEVPEGMVLFHLPGGDWAVFDCVGPDPQTLQSANTFIFSEWLPDNPEYALRGNASVEWYDCAGEPTDPDYRSAVWLPVKRRE